MTLKHRDTALHRVCVTPPSPGSAGSGGAPCTGPVTPAVPFVSLMDSTEPRQAAVGTQSAGNPAGPQWAHTPQTAAEASINIVAIAVTTHRCPWTDPTDGAERLMYRGHGEGPSALPSNPGPPQSRRDIHPGDIHPGDIHLGDIHPGAIHPEAASPRLPARPPGPSGAAQSPPTLPGSPAARGKWRPGASGSENPPERVLCPVWRLRWVGPGRAGSGSWGGAAAVTRVPHTEAFSPAGAAMADSTQNGPMAGGAGGGAVVRSSRAWGPGRPRCCSGSAGGFCWNGGEAPPARERAREQLSLSHWERAECAAALENGWIESSSVW